MSGDVLSKLYDELPQWTKCMPGEEGPLLRQALSDAQAEIERLRTLLREVAEHERYQCIGSDLLNRIDAALQSNPDRTTARVAGPV